MSNMMSTGGFMANHIPKSSANVHSRIGLPTLDWGSNVFDMLLHFTRDGEAFGPYPIEQAREYLKRGQILPTDLAWFEGCADWMPAIQVPGMIGAPGGASPPPPPPPPSTAVTPVILATYNNSNIKFNKKFMETELGRFLKLNPEGQTEQLFMRVRTGEEYLLYRVSKTEADHCVIQVDIDGVRKDKRVDYFNIIGIEVRQR